MNCAFLFSAISLSLRAMRQTNFSDSITHGPRINSGFAPPNVHAPIFNGLEATGMVETLTYCHPERKRRISRYFCAEKTRAARMGPEVARDCPLSPRRLAALGSSLTLRITEKKLTRRSSS